ncbi:Transmembrane and coiled-coil domain-containing protein 4 [Lonchura striata]|uniref:Transmembrane and coiled-coil domain-containing protein 4 n=1 Tax=Lonchura striata TaxID=40157 RepID=A0A218ULJ0_9PASE|nr:Transmembrane and coiled-coil domain-containing protein 4 [Lonchura striata domestica]
MSTLELNHQCSDTATLDMDCMICFNKYSIYRVPKLLDCQHTFCAVCLKLILRKEENTWTITCPLCRKPTLVSGGLIRTLQNKEDILERLESLDSNPEMYICAMGLGGNSWTRSSQDILNTEENSPAHSSLAVQRLLLLLLLGVILTMLILPFMYSGRVKWVKMAAEEKEKGWASEQQEAAEHGGESEPGVLLGRRLPEAGRFAYAALCGISLAWLFPENEQSSFRTDFIKGFVKWLDLPDAVLPAMTAFSDGLGGEGTETFTEILLKDPILKENPLLITQDLLSFSLQDGSYDARARVLICRVSWLLRLPLEDLEVLEESLLESLKEQKEEESDLRHSAVTVKADEPHVEQKLLGIASLGLTGGLAAPLVAAGAATIIGSAGAAALGSTAGIAVMASLFGAAGAGLTGYKMKKRVGAIEEFEFLPLTEGKQLHITIAITGWLCTGKYGSFTAPWSSMLHSSEQYCLAWESKYLMELGNALDSLLNGFVNMMAQEALKFTVLSGIVTALTWPASLLTVASVIDNPWGVCLHRSAEVGKHLAHILLSRQQGQRPVTLIGFSLGARVIYFCLQEMAQEKDSQGIIEDVVLLGAPVEGEAKHWRSLTRVVSGRIINGFCRTSSVQLNVAGLQPVDLDDRRMVNMDLSSVVNGHLDYMKQMDTILKAVGIKTKECQLEEKSSGSLFSPQAKKSQRAAGREAWGQEDTRKEKGEVGSEALPASCAHQQNSSSSALGEPSPPCPDCSHSTDSKDQAVGKGAN